MNKLQNNLEKILDIPQIESEYILKATKGKMKRLYNFKDYEMLRKVYIYRKAENWDVEIIVR